MESAGLQKMVPLSVFVVQATIPLVPNAWSMRSRHRLVPTSIAVVTGFVYLPHRTKPYVSVTLGTSPMVKTASVPHVKVLPAAVMVLVKSTTGMKPRVFVRTDSLAKAAIAWSCASFPVKAGNVVQTDAKVFVDLGVAMTSAVVCTGIPAEGCPCTDKGVECCLEHGDGLHCSVDWEGDRTKLIWTHFFDCPCVEDFGCEEPFGVPCVLLPVEPMEGEQ